MPELSKKIRKELRKLSDKAYKNQLDHELSILAKSFNDWENKRIDCFELSDRIHQFHDGSARDLWKRYNYSKDYLYLVAVAIVEGHIQESEVSEDALKELKRIIDSYNLHASE